MPPIRPRILSISFSDIRSDARVLRQLSLLRELGDVTTVGFGRAPDGVTKHYSVPPRLKTLPQSPKGVIQLLLRRYASAELAAPAIAWALTELAEERYDLVVANEARSLALAHRLAGGAPVWADLHEWAPEERTHILSWRLLVAPLMRHLCAAYLPRAAVITTVGDAIADLYSSQFGVDVTVMRNAGPYRELTPSETNPDLIRLVHSGVAVHGRRLELMFETLSYLDTSYRLDLYLMPAADNGRYLRELQTLAASDSRITFRDPVLPSELPDTLNAYDIGVFWIPPAHTNARLTLPNKFFDFVQARLAVAVGPSVEMAQLVEKYELGVVSDGFSPEQCADSLRAMDRGAIRRAKDRSSIAARSLNFEHDADAVRPLLERVLKRKG